MARHPPSTGSPRIAALLGPTFPCLEHATTWRSLRHLAEDLGAELRAFHAAMPDPRQLPEALRSAVGTGHFVPPLPMLHCDDVEHWRRQAPARFASLVGELVAATAMSEAGVVLRQEFQAACSHARWLQAWSPDLLVGGDLDSSGFAALVASRLLGVPLLLAWQPTTLTGPLAPLLHCFVADAELLLPSGPLPAAIEAAGTRSHRWSPEGQPTPELRAAGAALLQRPRPDDAPRTGPTAAFRPQPRTDHRPPAGVRPFVVVGAERTGSNLLVGQLDGQPQVVCANELFNPAFHRPATVPWLSGLDVDERHLARERAAAPGRLHQHLLADGQALGARAVGFKLLYFHFLVDQRIVDHLTALDDLLVVHLCRADRLRRWLSFQQARASQTWFASTAGPRPRQPAVNLDVPELLADLASQELFEARCRMTFASQPQLELEYAQFASDLDASTQRLGQHLGIPLQPRPSRSQKTGGEPFATAIANWPEIREALCCTRWSSLLDDRELQGGTP